KRTKLYAARLAQIRNLTVQQETVEDAVRFAALARTLPEVDPARVFVLGHSLGGYVAPRIAAQDGKLAGVVVLAGNVRALEDLILEQSEYLGVSGDRLNAVKAEIAKVKQLGSGKDEPAALLGLPASYFLDLKDYNPAKAASQLRLPLVILQGERDYQVTL